MRQVNTHNSGKINICSYLLYKCVKNYLIVEKTYILVKDELASLIPHFPTTPPPPPPQERMNKLTSSLRIRIAFLRIQINVAN